LISAKKKKPMSNLSSLDRSVFQETLHSVEISDQERQLVKTFQDENASKQLLHFSDAEIQEEQRATRLRPEFLRLLELKKQFLDEIDFEQRTNPRTFFLREKHAADCQEELDKQENDIGEDPNAFHEKIHRARMRETKTYRYVYANPRFMPILEQECPMLMSRSGNMRHTLVKAILLQEDADPTMMLVMLEALEMVERGEITHQEASMQLSKLALARDQYLSIIAERLKLKKVALKQQAFSEEEKKKVDLEISDEMKSVLVKSNQELKTIVESFPTNSLTKTMEEMQQEGVCDSTSSSKPAVHKDISYADFMAKRKAIQENVEAARRSASNA
jgi:hypothetical protein